MRPFLVAATLLLATPAFAAGTATIETTGPQGPQRMEVAWNDAGALRLGFPGRQAYMVVRDGTLYAVTTDRGRPMVMNMSEMGALAGRMSRGGMGGDIAPGLDRHRASTVVAIEATGASREIAGLPAREFMITWTDRTGRERTDRAMLSPDPLAVELTRAFQSLAAASRGTDRPDPRASAIDGRGLGTLAYGDSFTVTEIAAETPPADAFELPAAPMSLKDMMGGTGQ